MPLYATALVLQQELLAVRAAGNAEQIRLAAAKATQAGIRAMRARRYAGKKVLEWKVQGIRIGPCALIGVPAEPFIEISREIARRSPFPMTLFSGYSNGRSGYLPVRSAYAEGGYEVETSPFSPDAAEVLVRESLALLEGLQ